ncbi:MAG TPA: DUF1801 domain-containing protein [Candidatus Binatia bacterium]|jgi:uncharacterized protein YdhG (YjbR/CyaY superfamily)|nr:DUF1801 domain-containing protein [Candidatus Binatia bacterium]
MSVIDDYLGKYSGSEKAELEKLRSIVKTTVPEAEEVITYSMPGFKYKGKYLVAFSIFKDHIGLFPTSGPIETLKDKLTDFKTSKGGIHFTPAKPIPESLIKDILVTRMNEISNNKVKS